MRELAESVLTRHGSRKRRVATRVAKASPQIDLFAS